MGEISEALRRARAAESGAKAERVPVPPAPAAAPLEAVAVERIESLSREREGLWSPRALFIEDHGAAAECARHLGLRVRAECERLHVRSIAVVSALHDEGKTTVAGNLALALCSLSAKRTVALVDLDLRRPSLAKAIGVVPHKGFDDVLLGAASLDEACVGFESPALDTYPLRTSHASAHELLVRPEVESAIAALERRYEIVVIDTPPVLLVPDTPILLEHVGACLAVARSGHSRAQAFQRMCGMLPPGKLVGAVLDEGRLPTAAASYRYYESH